MMRLAMILPIVALSVSVAFAQDSAPSAKPPVLTLTPPKDAPPIVGAKSGPYPVAIEANPSLPTHTIYRPQNLSAFTGAKTLPIVAWGEGGCADAGLAFKDFLSNIGSYGFVLLAAGSKDTPLPDFKNPPAGPIDEKHLPPPKTKDVDLVHAIDWAIAENERKESPYYHHLNPQKVAVMGQSCGGLQAIVASADPRVRTSIIWNSGTFPDDSPLSNQLSAATKASLRKVHAPVAYINGGPADIAYQNSVDDVKRLTDVPVFFAWVNVGHGGTYHHPGGGRFAPAGVAWLEWRLNGDLKAAKEFQGKDCGLCKDPAWHVVRND